MVYGDHLQVPADFFCPGMHTGDVQALHESIQKFMPCHQTYKDTRQPFVPPDLQTSSYVLLRIDGQKPPLTAPYRGLFRVIRRNKKAFLIDLLSREEWVSIDHLKPAYLSADDQPTQHLSRAGHPLRPKRFS